MFIQIFIILLLSFVIYSNTLQNDFVWDDTSIVVNNKWIRNTSNFFKFFISKDTVSEDAIVKPKIYRPFTTFTYSVDYLIWGDISKLGFHFSNVFYHAVVSMLFYILCVLIIKEKNIAFLSGLIFATHPIHTEAVSWVKGRADVLATMFCLLSFIFYIYFVKNKNLRNYIFSLIAFLLGLFSKESAITFPLIVILYDIYFFKVDIRRYIPFFILSFIYVLIRKSVLGIVAPCGWWAGSIYYTFLTMSKVLVEYFRLLVLPINLCADYVVPISFSIFEPKVIFSILLIIIVLAISFCIKKIYPIISFSILFIFITLLPVLNIIPIEVLLAERFLYLPSVGFCILLGSLMHRFFINKKIFLYVFTSLIVIFYSGLTFTRNYDWKDGFSLWSRTVRQMPNNFRAHNNLGMEYEKLGDYESALRHYKTALTLIPNLSWIYNDTKQMYARVYNNIGNIYFNLGDYQKALDSYSKSIYLDPIYSQPYFNLGLFFRKQGVVDLAIKYYRKAIELNPYSCDYWNNLGVAYAMKDDFINAIYAYNKAIELSTDENFKNNVLKNIQIAESYLSKGKK